MEQGQVLSQVRVATFRFMRTRKSDGRWVEKFDEFAWGGPYVEGGPSAMFLGSTARSGRPDRSGRRSEGHGCQARQDDDRGTERFTSDFIGGVIHEMARMAAVKFGQYDPGNQPVHHVPVSVRGGGATVEDRVLDPGNPGRVFLRTEPGFPGRRRQRRDVELGICSTRWGFIRSLTGRPEVLLLAGPALHQGDDPSGQRA